MSLRYALLGLLAHGPASGYDLMGLFRTSLSHVWPATQSQVYGELNRLADAGLVAVGDTGPRGRREFAITGDGRAALDGWITDVAATPPQRSDLLLHVFFLGLVPPEQARGYLERQARLAGERLAGLRELAASLAPQGGSLAGHGRLALEYGVRLAAMQREWAEWAAGQIGDDDR